MSKIVIGTTTDGKNAQIDVDVLLRTRLLLQANSGKGKSWLLRKLCELLFGKVQVIVIDPEGEFATLREKYDYVLVGKGGETAAHPRIASLTAQRLLELRASAVIDLYEMKPSERHAYVKAFLEAMIDAPKNLWHPVVVIVDEAHIFCPEKGAGESEASESFIGLATRGRKRGYCLVAATQRLGKLRKDAASELNNVIIGGTFIDVDRKRAADALGVYGPELHPFFNEIRILERGKFYCLGPAIATERVLVEVGQVETTHPEAGSSKYAGTAPPTPAKIKELLPRLADLPKEAEEKARTVAELQKKVRELEIELRKRPTTVETKIEEKIVETPAISKDVVDQLVSLAEDFRDVVQDLTGAIATVKRSPAPVVRTMPGHLKGQFKISSPRLLPDGPKVSRFSDPSPSGETLPVGEKAVLTAVAQFGEVEREQLTVLTGYKRSSRDAYIARLSGKGYVEVGRTIKPTQSGLDALGSDYEPLPTGSELFEYWKRKLPEGELRILQVLVDAGRGKSVDKVNLGEEIGYKRSSRDAYLSRLAAKRLVESSGGYATASDSLFD